MINHVAERFTDALGDRVFHGGPRLEPGRCQRVIFRDACGIEAEYRGLIQERAAGLLEEVVL
jgi:hypothetical protein